MSWHVVNSKYRAIPIISQIQNLSEGMYVWATDFEKSLGVNEKAAFVIKTMFTQKQRKGITTEKISYTYNVVNDGKKGDDFSELLEKISQVALGNQNSFGVFVQMEEKEDPESFLSYENFYGSVVQVRDEYTRQKMLEELGLVDNSDVESVSTQKTFKK
jgi:hypothetical protein